MRKNTVSRHPDAQLNHFDMDNSIMKKLSSSYDKLMFALRGSDPTPWGDGKSINRRLARVNIDQAFEARANRPHRGGAESEKFYDLAESSAEGPADPQAVYDQYISESDDGTHPLRAGPISLPEEAQKGLGQQLALEAMADGTLSSSEKEALGDLADQQYQEFQQLPWLHFREASVLDELIEAPNDEFRSFLTGLIGKETLTLSDVLPLAQMIQKHPVSDSFLSEISGNQLMGVPTDESAFAFLGHLNHQTLHSTPSSYEAYLGTMAAVNAAKAAAGQPQTEATPAHYQILKNTIWSGK